MYLVWAQGVNDREGRLRVGALDKSTGDIHTYLAIPNRFSDATIAPVNFSAGVSAPAPLPQHVRRFLQRGYRRPGS